MSLSFNQFSQDVEQLVDATLQAANPATAVSNHLNLENKTLVVAEQSYQLNRGKLYLISAGKAAIPMAQAAVRILGNTINVGICLTKDSDSLDNPDLPDNIQFYTGEHPVTGKKSLAATTAVQQLLAQTKPEDVVLCLISGGCSALLSKPILPLADWQTLNEALLASGCSINEFNTVRRQLDTVKGGGLTQWAAPAKVATLILSDVIGNDLKAIGSGPTVPSLESTLATKKILEQYQIQEKLPAQLWISIQAHLEAIELHPQETAVQNKIIGDVRIAAKAMARQAEHLGFSATVLTTHLEGEAKEAGRFAAAIAKDLQPGSCIIIGGETTVTLKGNGIGGRNLEVALSTAIGIEGLENCLIFTLATDGDDGPTQCAGAIVHGMTVENGRKQNLDALHYLTNNDSYTYFSRFPDHLIKTGPTGTNVNDLICILKYPD